MPAHHRRPARARRRPLERRARQAPRQRRASAASRRLARQDAARRRGARGLRAARAPTRTRVPRLTGAPPASQKPSRQGASWSTTSTWCGAPTPRSTRSGASASASTLDAGRRGRAARARAPAGAKTSTASATGCRRPTNPTAEQPTAWTRGKRPVPAVGCERGRADAASRCRAGDDLDRQARPLQLDPTHLRGRHKARVFASALGIRTQDWRYLHDQTSTRCRTRPCASTRITPFGVAYEVVVRSTD